MQNYPSYEEVLALKLSGEKKVWVVLSEKYGMSKDALRSWFNREKIKNEVIGEMLEQEDNAPSTSVPSQEAQLEIKNKAEEVYNYNADGSVLSASSKRIIALSDEEKKSPESVLIAHGFDPKLWTIVTALNNYWDGMRPDDLGLRKLYQSKITVKPKVESQQITLEDVTAWFEGLGSKNISKKQERKVEPSRSTKMLLVPLADFHFGNGGDNNHVDDIYEYIKIHCQTTRFEEIWLVNMGDLLHMDNYHGQTTDGTQVSSRGRIYDAWDGAVGSLIELISRVKEFARVRFVSISGNHDRVNSYTAANAISLYFDNDDDVICDVEFEDRKYLVFGRVLMGFAHGDVSGKNMQTLIQREARNLYGDTDFSYMFFGHLHHMAYKDESGVGMYQLPSPTPVDEWHEQKGFVGSWRGTQIFTIDAGFGIINIGLVSA